MTPRAHLHDGAGGQHLLLHVGVPRGPPHRGEEAHGVLGRHRLPRAGLAAHDDGLVPLISVEEEVKGVDKLLFMGFSQMYQQ